MIQLSICTAIIIIQFIIIGFLIRALYIAEEEKRGIYRYTKEEKKILREFWERNECLNYKELIGRYICKEDFIDYVEALYNKWEIPRDSKDKEADIVTFDLLEKGKETEALAHELSRNIETRYQGIDIISKLIERKVIDSVREKGK